MFSFEMQTKGKQGGWVLFRAFVLIILNAFNGKLYECGRLRGTV